MKPRPNILNSAQKNFYLVLPYFGHKSESLKFDLLKILKSHYESINFQIILVNKSRIRNFFSFKDVLPISMRAGVVYKFSCTEGSTPMW